ncbi:MAG TPA: hypothetical protein DEP72_01455 [Clostridiales bacterium]|nr:MAG: hypothetical protein A2Y18_05190 [Clostridiales bacterium GWD2_32_19]HCC06820.1 hypothetical protein [Clostridiales bacterium]
MRKNYVVYNGKYGFLSVLPDGEGEEVYVMAFIPELTHKGNEEAEYIVVEKTIALDKVIVLEKSTDSFFSWLVANNFIVVDGSMGSIDKIKINTTKIYELGDIPSNAFLTSQISRYCIDYMQNDQSECEDKCQYMDWCNTGRAFYNEMRKGEGKA